MSHYCLHRHVLLYHHDLRLTSSPLRIHDNLLRMLGMELINFVIILAVSDFDCLNWMSQETRIEASYIMHLCRWSDHFYFSVKNYREYIMHGIAPSIYLMSWNTWKLIWTYLFRRTSHCGCQHDSTVSLIGLRCNYLFICQWTKWFAWHKGAIFGHICRIHCVKQSIIWENVRLLNFSR